MSIKYKKGYKYQLAEDYTINIPRFCGYNINNTFLSLDMEGNLTIHKGYSWDGASFLAIDTKSSMRGALIHDSLYQILREGYIPLYLRIFADMTAREIWIEDGMYKWRAWLWYKALRKFGNPAADPAHIKPILTAP